MAQPIRPTVYRAEPHTTYDLSATFHGTRQDILAVAKAADQDDLVDARLVSENEATAEIVVRVSQRTDATLPRALKSLQRLHEIASEQNSIVD